ncbi:MAG: molybdopterin-dependent oxidoreductase [Lentisphaeria bacterium]|nr:molybdopterin-dependent oxidoreductase [Lentisphaeria bacterium]
MRMTRREYMRNMALASASAAAASLVPGVLFAEEIEIFNQASVKWDKAPCRFCGVGCGLLIGVREGKAVAVKGDPESTVNHGLCCVKGYHSVMSIYGSDRLKHAYVRKNGKLEQVSVEEALDLVADKMKQTIAEHGKDSVSMYGSGQWTIPDGFVASKFMKGCIGTNNLEANARLCMASAVTGFMTSFGLDEPMGCYDDIEHSNVFVMWGNNMSEMHPVLFSRILNVRQRNPQAKIIDLSTRDTRTSKAADYHFLFTPQSDLAIANGICYEIVKNDWVNHEFVKKHTNFHSGKTQIGYGLEDKFAFTDKPEPMSFEQYKAFLEDYTPEKVEKISGVKADDIRFLAQVFADPKNKVSSFWCMGMNQHTRGTWINNLVYNIHLLLGKISTPGNNPFSLTGQPSACGTVREVGTLTHKLPHGEVSDPKAREMAAKIWNVPVERIDPKPSLHTVEMFRALDRGDLRFMWIQVTNPMVTMPKLNRYREATLKQDRFIVVSDIYQTPTTDIADVILPSAMWIEREGMYGNSERRTQHFNKMIDPPGEAISDTWQIIQVAKRLGFDKEFAYSDENHIEEIWAEYCQFHNSPKHAMAPYEVLKARPGVRWPFWNGKETRWRYNSADDPAAKKEGFDFYGKPEGRAWIWARPYEPPPENPDQDYPFWLNTGRVIEHWHSGSMTRRIPVLHQAVPEAYVEINPIDAKRMNIQNGELIEVTSRRGTIQIKTVINGRGRPPKGQVFIPFFDESYLINELTLDAFCPISKQPDYKKCAVKIIKIS